MHRPPVRLQFLFVSALVAGCFPDARGLDEAEHLEADRLAIAYQETFDVTLEDRQLDCLHSVEVVVSTAARDRWCEAYACYWVDAVLPRRRGVMFFPDEIVDLPEPSHGQLLRHELLHRLLHCVQDDGDVGHVHPGWAGSPYVPAPATSIVASAEEIDPSEARGDGEAVARVEPLFLGADLTIASTLGAPPSEELPEP